MTAIDLLPITPGRRAAHRETGKLPAHGQQGHLGVQGRAAAPNVGD
jgi:hypothetical protein